MSILPADAQRSASSSPKACSLDHSAGHGFILQPSTSSISFSNDTAVFESLETSDSESSLAMPNNIAGPLATAAEVSDQSSEEVGNIGIPDGMKTLPHHISKQLPHYTVDKMFGASRHGWNVPRVSLQGNATSGLVKTHGNSALGKKPQVTNGNHLLNFRYSPVNRPRPRTLPPKRHHKVKPYNKDLFLQANYRFVVLDSGNDIPESTDPDKMLQWEDIICLMYSSPHPVLCPICLDYPLCPQITSCGHIFCFPCILHYLLMGQEDDKGDCWKKCPLCFMMICVKDLYTIYIESVKNYHVGDTIEFMLLTRQKDSNILFQKYKHETVNKGSCSGDAYDSFSKFTFTSDVNMSVRQAMSDLESWLVRADSGLVDDLELLPYVSAAMEQLKQRKNYWNEHKKSSSIASDKNIDCLTSSHVHSSENHSSNMTYSTRPTIVITNNSPSEFVAEPLDEGSPLFRNTDIDDSFNGHDGGLTSLYDEKNSLWRHNNGSKDTCDDLYSFYQAVDGQHLILHPLNMKCFLYHYGSYDMMPHRITGNILQLETITQSEAIRRRYRFLSHFSLTTTFQLCEIDLSEILPPDSVSPFSVEIKNREKQRKRLARKEQLEKSKAEAAIADSVLVCFNTGETCREKAPRLCMDELSGKLICELLDCEWIVVLREGLGSEEGGSKAIEGERMSFSSVTKLGFAAAHDSPSSLNVDKNKSGEESGMNVASRRIRAESRLKKGGKKAVLLSTAGGRRY